MPPAGAALEGKGPQWRFNQRLEEVATAVGGDYCRLQTPLKLPLAVSETVAGHRLGVLEGGGGRGRGLGTQKFVYQKWPDQIFPIRNFVCSHDGHFGLRGRLQINRVPESARGGGGGSSYGARPFYSPRAASSPPAGPAPPPHLNAVPLLLLRDRALHLLPDIPLRLLRFPLQRLPQLLELVLVLRVGLLQVFLLALDQSLEPRDLVLQVLRRRPGRMRQPPQDLSGGDLCPTRSEQPPKLWPWTFGTGYCVRTPLGGEGCLGPGQPWLTPPPTPHQKNFPPAKNEIY